jgi:hypothetical protein
MAAQARRHQLLLGHSHCAASENLHSSRHMQCSKRTSYSLIGAGRGRSPGKLDSSATCSPIWGDRPEKALISSFVEKMPDALQTNESWSG